MKWRTTKSDRPIENIKDIIENTHMLYYDIFL